MSENTSKVYFTDFRCKVDEGPAHKLSRLIDKAGLGEIDMDGKFVAIKMHFGELGNMSYLRPNYAKAIVDYVKARGGKPFLTDCNTMYPGFRKNAIEHLYCAWENGFTPLTVGCPVIIGDGLKGTDDIAVPVVGGEYVKEARIGHAIMDADIFISLAHFKGHELTGFGGAIKNIGMGCGSRAGKQEQHCNGKAQIDPEKCRGCKRCLRECANNGLQFDEATKKMTVTENCVGCGRCLGACNFDAIDFCPSWRKCGSQPPHGRIRQGCCLWPPKLPCQHRCRRVAKLRLPQRQRRANAAGYRHVRILRSAGSRPGLRRRLPGAGAAAKYPAH